MPKRLLIIAGEVSGDMHAGGLLKAIRDTDPTVQAFGIGGESLQAAGMEVFHHSSDMAAVGFAEVLPKLPFFRRVFKGMLALARERKPDAVILVDYPGFNLRFAEKAHALGLKVIYYICPQVWAWHKSRIPKMAHMLDRLIVIFPFEPAVFDGTGLKVDYVGHPLVDEIHPESDTQEPELPWNGSPRVAILPGSRTQEVQRLLPIFASAAAEVTKKSPEAGVIVAAPSDKIAQVARHILNGLAIKPERCTVVSSATRRVLRQASAAFIASGTATIETALAKCPMVIAYRVAPLSFLFLKGLVTVDHIGMVNIVAGRRLCPEFVQGDATPVALSSAILPLLADGPERTEMVRGFEKVADTLGPGGSHKRAAEVILSELGIRG